VLHLAAIGGLSAASLLREADVTAAEWRNADQSGAAAGRGGELVFGLGDREVAVQWL
jgi:hypothetical protein